MRIDDAIEERMREAFRGVIAESAERVVAASSDVDERTFGQMLGYALHVARDVLSDAFPGGPSGADLQLLSERIVQAEETWVDLGGVGRVRKFLEAVLVGGEGLQELAPRELSVLPFVVGAHLVAAYRDDDQKWWDYLDEIWARVESPEA